MELKEYRRASEIARGIEKADLVFKNCRVVNVLTEEIYEGDIAVAGEMIAGVGRYEGKQEIDMKGCYACPGLIDSHLHLESTLVTPKELIAQAAGFGTTTFIVDPHESANVAGDEGIEYILQQTEKTSANVYVMMPSCVPSTDIDDNGGSFLAEDMKKYLNNPRILGLGEVMDCLSVVEGNARMHEKLQLFADKIKDGHAPLLNSGDLSAYAMAGIKTDHECVDYEYAMEERRRGMYVHIREGSAARNLEAIVRGIVENDTDCSGFCFCTDDKHIEEIREEGHINFNVKKAVSLGIDPIKAIKMATLHPAVCYGLKHLGAIAPGYQADLVFFEDLKEFTPKAVYWKGKEIEKNQEVVIDSCNPELKHTVHVAPITPQELSLKKNGNKCHVLKMISGQIITEDVIEEVPGGEYFQADHTYKKIAVIERHKNSGKIGIGILKGFGIRGAAASSVSHDSHNLIVIGDNDEDMALAVNRLVECQGGYCLARDGKIVDTLPLPIMGLVSDAGYENVNKKLKEMIVKAHEMGVPKDMEPFITMSFMALPVIPAVRVTPRGVYLMHENKILKTPFEIF